MTDAKTPKVLILIAILALVGALLVAGCGGGGSSSSAETSATTPEESVAPEESEAEPEEGEAEPEESEAEPEEGEGEAGGGESAALAEGKTVFTTDCASCHALKEAGASGEVGPNLDELEPSEGTVEQQVINGGGPMPAFGKEGLLTTKEIKAVATYVSSVAGTE
jgi:mono/diheme cytochrome c family protein